VKGPKSSPESGVPLEQRIVEIRSRLQAADPTSLAARTGASYHPAGENRGEFRLKWWNTPVRIAFPSFGTSDAVTDEPLDVMSQAMLASYFHDSDGTLQG